VLYGAAEVFARRCCYCLTYASQREALYFRDLGKAQKIRIQMSERFPDKPKGNHRAHNVTEDRFDAIYR